MLSTVFMVKVIYLKNVLSKLINQGRHRPEEGRQDQVL
jgi:hypothetical protein